MESLEIRAVQRSDTDRLLPLMAAYWAVEAISGFDAVKIHRQLQDFISNPSYGGAWLAARAGIAAGYLVCSFIYSFEHGGLMAEVDELYVDAPWRRQGVARRLLAAARAELAARACVSLQMQVADDNERAQRFYAQLGFRQKPGYRLWVAPLPGQGLAYGTTG
jgi:ribosomal protein S18 acetylase RimI-like enzyme